MSYFCTALEWTLVTANAYCKQLRDGDDKYVGHYNMSGCMKRCNELQANMFAYDSWCRSGKCSCYCQMSTVNDGPCACETYNGYNLYQIKQVEAQINHQCCKSFI